MSVVFSVGRAYALHAVDRSQIQYQILHLRQRLSQEQGIFTSTQEETSPDETQRSYHYASEICHALSAVAHRHNIMKTYAIASLFATAMLAAQPVVSMTPKP